MFVVNRLVKRNFNRIAVAISNRGTRDSHSQITSGLPDVEIPRVSLGEYILEHASKWENNTAYVCGVTGRQYTYNEVRTKSKNFAGALRKKLKLDKGDVIAVLLPNIPEFPIVILGALRAGVIATTVNPIWTPAEISRQLVDSSTKVIVTLTEFSPLAHVTRELVNKNIPIVTIKAKRDDVTPVGTINFSELTDNAVDFTEDNQSGPDDVALLPYSSGTTGLPKGVQLTHRNIVSNLCQLEHPLIGCNVRTTANHQDVSHAVLPLFHIYGLTILCSYQLRLGCKVITLPKFTPELYINTLRNYKPTALFVVPPIALFLTNHPTIKEADFKSIRAIVSGAALFGVSDEEKLLKKTNKNIAFLRGYGMTETSPVVITQRSVDVKDKDGRGSIGKPVPNTQVRVIAADATKATNLGPNEIGELVVKGPQVMKGYLNRPDEDIFIDGWMRTGDMMYYNDAGYFYITGRLKELIKVKGFQVPPAELEEVIRKFPGVEDVGVIGIPHGTDGEVPRAYVVVQPGKKVDLDKLRDYVNKNVASYKQLRGGIEFIDSIPKNATGKILRQELKEIYDNEKS